MTTPSTAMTTPSIAISELCQILGTSVEPTQEQLRNILDSLFSLLAYCINMVSKMSNKWQIVSRVPVDGIMSVKDLLNLFNDVKPFLTLVYYGYQVDNDVACKIIDVMWNLAYTVDDVIRLSRSSNYQPCQAVEAVSVALFCVYPMEEEEEEEEVKGLLQRLPAPPYDYLHDVLTALQGQ